MVRNPGDEGLVAAAAAVVPLRAVGEPVEGGEAGHVERPGDGAGVRDGDGQAGRQPSRQIDGQTDMDNGKGARGESWKGARDGARMRAKEACTGGRCAPRAWLLGMDRHGGACAGSGRGSPPHVPAPCCTRAAPGPWAFQRRSFHAGCRFSPQQMSFETAEKIASFDPDSARFLRSRFHTRSLRSRRGHGILSGWGTG